MSENPMHSIRVEKVTINMGTGKSTDQLQKSIKLVKGITGVEPVKCITTKKIAAWGLRPGIPVGCKLTLRGEQAKVILDRLLYAKDYVLKESSFDGNGNIAFGIREYIDIKDAQYDPSIGMLGMQITVTLGRAGYRVKRRSVRPTRVGKKHVITKQDAINYLGQQYKVKLEEKGEQ